jgi:hypothetical protein
LYELQLPDRLHGGSLTNVHDPAQPGRGHRAAHTCILPPVAHARASFAGNTTHSDSGTSGRSLAGGDV